MNHTRDKLIYKIDSFSVITDSDFIQNTILLGSHFSCRCLQTRMTHICHSKLYMHTDTFSVPKLNKLFIIGFKHFCILVSASHYDVIITCDIWPEICHREIEQNFFCYVRKKSVTCVTNLKFQNDIFQIHAK